jgi:hypothetical protein
MTPFEYVIVLISIILGMGITQIVTGIADLVHQWERAKVYWPHLLWVIVVFILHIQDWWSTYALRNFPAFRLPTFLFILLYPINLFILARILFPGVQPEGEFDLKKFYFANYRKLFLSASLLPFISMLNNSIILGYPWWTQAGHFAIVITFVFLMTRKNIPEYVHKILAVVLLGSMLTVLGFMWNDLLE